MGVIASSQVVRDAQKPNRAGGRACYSDCEFQFFRARRAGPKYTLHMKLATVIEHRRRVRSSVEHLAHTLQTRPHSWPSLAELAEVASLSPYHFIRVYRRAVGETPQVTVRRLKLDAARRQLLERRSAGVLDVALDHGYESAQAFSRAYQRQFGTAPGAQRRQDPARAVPAVRSWLAEVPVLSMQTMALPRESEAVPGVFDEFMGHLDMAGVPRFGQDMFCVISPGLALVAAGALQNRWVDRSLRLSQGHFGGKLHLCAAGQPDVVWQRLRQAGAVRHRDEANPILLRYVNDPAYKARAEQLVEVYVPLAISAAQAKEAGL
jgi:AraC-like DNA-binding protein